jgi:Tol biopolymer transport system component
LALAAALIVAGAAQSGTSLRGQGQIAFDGFLLDANIYQLYRERPDGTGRVRLTHGPNDYMRPHWSPDGTKLVAEGPPGLVILSRDGVTLRRITVAGDTFDAQWSPTGARIAYLELHCQDPAGHEDPGCADLWVMRPDGSGRRRLTASGVSAFQGLDSLYSWSPDGRRIAYVSLRGMAVVDVATGTTRVSWNHPKLIAQYPAWSPDGKWIMFSKQRGSGQLSDLALMAPNGSRLHVLPHTKEVVSPVWSPDGRHIAYIASVNLPTGTDYAAYVARPDGSGRVKVTPSDDDRSLLWSPDSSHVLVIGPGDSFWVARADGKGTRLRIQGGEDPAWGR